MSAPLQTNIPEGSAPNVAPPYVPPPQAVPTRPPRNNRTGAIIAVVALVVLVPALLCAGIALFAGGVGIFVATHQVEQTATNQFQLTVPDHPTIAVTDAAGQVTITSGAVKQVTVSATKRARATNSATARQMLDGITVTAVPTANGVRVDATTSQQQPLGQQSVDLRITVPQSSDLNLTVNVGTLQISSISGVLKVMDSAGTLNLRDVTLEGATTLNVSTGTIHFDGTLAANSTVAMTVGTGSADISLPQSSATHLDAAAQVGSISVSGWLVTVTRTSTGRSAVVDLNAQPTSTLTVRVDVGSVTVAAR